MMRRGLFSLLLCGFLLFPSIFSTVRAQSVPESEQIEAAVQAAPEEFRDGARVLGYGSDGELTTLREGSNHLVCLGDDPADSRVHVACYHNSLEPFMARGRQLGGQGMSRSKVDSIRLAEIRSGELAFPDHPVTLYSLTGAEGSANSGDRVAAMLEDASRLHVVYVPYATGESTGLPTRPAGSRPWLMEPGTPWAHIMISIGG